MDQAITIGQVLTFVFIVAGIASLLGFLYFLIWLFNPFRSGH